MPLARREELIVEELDAEVLIYDKRTHEAHCLSPAAGQVWRACDGKTSREQLAAELGLEADTVKRALDELEACGLLDGGANAGVTRREATTRFAKVGATAAAAPLIYSIVGPIPEAAASVPIEQCLAGQNSDCGTPGCFNCTHCGCCCCQTMTTPPSGCTSTIQCCLPPGVCTSTAVGGHCSSFAPVCSPTCHP
jgi:hypothetical protein